jgi:hypothetical protein
MTWLRRPWVLLRKSAAPAPLPEQVDAVRVEPPAELERLLGVWTRWWAPSGNDESDDELAQVRRRAEAELRRFFGQDTLHRVQGDYGGESRGKGTVLLAADRLFVAFLGTRAAMAVTRKLYSNLK